MRWIVALSVLLHVGVLLALVLVIRHTPQEAPPAPTEIAMVFDQGGVKQQSAPHPTKQPTEIPNGETSATPETSGGSPQSAPAPSPTPPAPAPAETPTPPTPPTPSVTETAPPPPEVSLSPYSDLAPPEPTPQPQPAMRPAQPQRVARPAARPHANPFSHPMQLGFGPPTEHAARGLRHSRSLDLNVGPVIQGGQLLDAVTHVTRGNASADWRKDVEEWIETHKFYPPQAAANGEDGTSIVSATIRKDGHVMAVKLIGSAGSRWLDLSTLGIFRDQNLPPFPDDMKDQDVTITLDMNYVLEQQQLP